MASAARSGTVMANGARLYYEKAGAGPTALFIAGSTGDAGNFTRAADLLADEFTVVTYDRRSNSRSPRPSGWTTTSVSEQADDAAALIRELALAPVALFAASAGALIGLDLVIRHPELVRVAVLQEPLIYPLVPPELLASRHALVQEAMKAGGPRAAVEDLLRHLNDDKVLEAIPADVLARMLGNADTILTIETAFAAWQPREDDLASLRVPVVLVIARDTLPPYRHVMTWLEARLGTKAIVVNGPHGFYYYRPQDLADVVRPIFRSAPA